ncbi:MAG: hypothetical protein VCB25_12180, partial [Myxococcota bacterium]
MSVRIRCWIKQTLFVLFATIAISNSAGATILVEFTGSVDQFNYGPLTPFSSITGSFMIDDGIDSTGSLGIRDFDGAVDDFSLEIDDTILGMLLFSGQDGVFSQFCSTPPDEAYGPCGTGGHFISVGVGGSNGSVTGS